MQFGDTLPLASGQAGDTAGPSDTQRLEESASANKPLRRAQIFDKGVDASMIQVRHSSLVLQHMRRAD